MSAPRLLDLFSGAGGAGEGYRRAGFDVTGVDIKPMPNNPHTFIQADALEYVAAHGHEYDAIHASPPCQPYSRAVTSRSSRWNDTLGKDEPALIEATRALLQESGRPYVIENVVGAPLQSPILLCGSMFGLHIARHRLFEIHPFVLAPLHPDCRGIAKRHAELMGWDYRDMSVTGKGRRAGTSSRWASLLGVDWPMRQRDLKEAIPPAYTFFIGQQLINVVINRAGQVA